MKELDIKYICTPYMMDGKTYIDDLGETTSYEEFYKAMEQAINDAREGEYPVVAHKKNGKDWLVTMLAEDWIALYDRGNNGN